MRLSRTAELPVTLFRFVMLNLDNLPPLTLCEQALGFIDIDKVQPY
jgi:hypothetical protein